VNHKGSAVASRTGSWCVLFEQGSVRVRQVEKGNRALKKEEHAKEGEILN